MSVAAGKGGARRGWLIGLAVVALVAGLLRLRFDADVLSLLPAELPVVRGLKLHQANFASARDLIITVRAPDAEAAAAAAKSLALRLRAASNLVADAVWQPPLQENAAAAGAFLAWLWLNQPPEAFAEMAARLASTNVAATLEAARAQLATSLSPDVLGRLGYDPFGFSLLPAAENPLAAAGEGGNWFASPDGAFRVVFVRPRAAAANYRESAAWLAEVQALARDWGAREAPSVTLAYTGSPAFVAEAATGMERDLSGSLTGTLLVIGALFGWAHRRWVPLLWLCALLLVVLVTTLALGGLIFGTLNVVSLGFAAVLLGLGVDYALVLYQEAAAEPDRTPAEIRRLLGPGIWWSALTTGGAFLLLNFAGLPGLSELGSLVALGVLLGAAVMLAWYLPVALPKTRTTATEPGAARPLEAGAPPTSPRSHRVAWGATVALTLFCLVTLARGRPRVDHSTAALEPAGSRAGAALREMQRELGQGGEVTAVILQGRDEEAVAARLERLRAAWPANAAAALRLPTALWPKPGWQRQNLPLAAQLADQAAALRAAATNAGFTPEALPLADAVLATWQAFGSTAAPAWPTNTASRWLLDKFAARTPDGWLALGVVEAPVGAPLPAGVTAAIEEGGGLLASWSLLGEVLLARVEHRVVWLAAAMFLLVAGCLWMAFRRWVEVLLSLATVAAAVVVLLAIMQLAGWSWNLINLTALPLILGAGEDYSLHVQLALRRHGGDVRMMRRVTGRALFLCAATTITGFGSLCWSGNAGLASLGLICAIAIAVAYGVSLYLLPAWWQAFAGQLPTAPAPARPSPAPPATPSSLYRGSLWQAARRVARILPDAVLGALCRAGASCYGRLAADRFEAVVDNLLPVCGGDAAAARRTARRLFANFGRKLADLWRQESGAQAEPNFLQLDGNENLAAARRAGRGVLLVTPHLGNWELGSPLALSQGLDLLIITQAEPDEHLTAIRATARHHFGVRTLVIGRNPFAFVEVIKHLQAGGAVALLLDRPPAASAVDVALFGRPFRASIAAAELARASGCSVLGVHITRAAGGHRTCVMPLFEYDRAALGSRAGRIAFTQEILRAFEPAIRQHADQWYHFVPIWPETRGPRS